MNRSAKSLLTSAVVTLALAITACGGGSMTVDAGRPWEALPDDVTGVIHVDMTTLLKADLYRSLAEKFGKMPTGEEAGWMSRV